MMTAWAHLPNAAYIDVVLRHIRIYYDAWQTPRAEGLDETDRRRTAESRLVTDLNQGKRDRIPAMMDAMEAARNAAREFCAQAAVKQLKLPYMRAKDIPREHWISCCETLGRKHGAASLAEVKGVLAHRARVAGMQQASFTYGVNAVRALAIYDDAATVLRYPPVSLSGTRYIPPEQVLLNPACAAAHIRKMALPRSRKADV